MKKIFNSELSIIKSNPSTLGTLDYYIVLYDKLEFNKIETESWFKENEHEIAQNLYETGEYKNIYVIHSTTTLGEDIKFLNEVENMSTYNRINCDSILSYHCLGILIDKTKLIIRTGFHEVDASINHSGLPFDWDLMSNISNGYKELETDKVDFFKSYFKIIEIWKNQITKSVWC